MKAALIFRITAVCLILTGWLESCKPKEDTPPPDPVITRISPESGNAGTLVSISGKGFAPTAVANRVLLNSMPVSVQEVQGDTLLRISVPDSATSGAMQVQVNGGTLVNGPLFVVPRNANPPVLVSVSPATVEPGDVITITGSNFLTGAALQDNTVRVSGLKVEIVSGTATELKVLVPGLPRGDNPVTVAVRGTASNALKVQVPGFPGKMVWVSFASPGRPGSKNITYRAVANADGSTVARQITPVPAGVSQIFFGGFANNAGAFKNLFTYNRKSNLTYIYSGRSVYNPTTQKEELYRELWQADPELTNFKLIYNFDVKDDLFKQVNSITSIGEGFYLYPVENISSTIDLSVIEGFKDGAQAPVLRRKLSATEFNNDFRTFDFISGEENITLTAQYQFNPTNSQPVTRFISEAFASENLITSVAYLPADKKFYFSTAKIFEPVPTFAIYRVAEAGGTPEKLAEYTNNGGPFGKDPSPRFLQVVDTPIGIKLFWVSFTPAGTQSINLLSLKGQPPYRPVILYNKPEEVPGDPFTLPDLPGRNSNSITIFYVTNN
jgi:IPT/TIG domain